MSDLCPRPRSRTNAAKALPRYSGKEKKKKRHPEAHGKGGMIVVGQASLAPSVGLDYGGVL